MRTFIAESTETFDIGRGDNQTQVALVTFSTVATTQFSFNDHTSRGAVTSAVNQLTYERCLCKDPATGDFLLTNGRWCQTGCAPATRTSLGLRRAQELFADPSSGARPASTTQRVVVVITDGEANEGFSPTVLGAELVAEGVTVIAVGVNLGDERRGSGRARTALNGMVGGTGRVLNVNGFDELSGIISDLHALICGGDGSGGGGAGGMVTGGSDVSGASTCPAPRQRREAPRENGGVDRRRRQPEPADGYLWSIAITATLKLAPRTEPLVPDASQLTINNDGSGVLLPGDEDETSIDAGQLQMVTNDALRLRGSIGFRVRGRRASCLREMTGRFFFRLADDAALMSVFGSPYVHVASMSLEVKWNFAEFPYVRELSASGQLYVGSFGRAALCVLDRGCTGVVALGAQFTFSRDLRRQNNHFGISAFLQPQGTNALVDVYEAISDVPLSSDRRQWLALLSGLDYGLEIHMVTGAQERFTIEMVGELTAAKLPSDSQDDLVDGDCNVACQLLHEAMGATTIAQVSIAVDWSERNGVQFSLSAAMRDAAIVLASRDGAPSVTLVELYFEVVAEPAAGDSEGAFKVAIGGSVDLADGPRLTGEIGFSVADSRRRTSSIAVYFKLGLRYPFYNAFGSESTHIMALNLEVEVGGGGGQGISLPNLEATGELCLGRQDACAYCDEGGPELRILTPECQGPVFAAVTIGIRIPGQSNIADPDALTAETVCQAPHSGGGGGWEFFVQARVEATNGVGALSRIQNALAGNDASQDANERMNTFAGAVFVLRLTLGPSRVKLSVEAQLHKLDLPPNDAIATSTRCDMICQMCHTLLDNADPGSYIFVKGEFGATVAPFSLSVAVGAGFDGRIEYPDKGLTLTRTGITLIFAMDPAAISFEIQLYGSFIKEQDETFGATDGLVYSGSSPTSVVLFRDPHTNEVYGQTTNAVMDGFTAPLQLDGAFALRLTKGRKGDCATPSTPGIPSVIGSISFAMRGWKMKFLGKRCHIGNTAFDLAMTSTPPYFSSFAGQTEVCFGTTGRCAQCILGADCARTIYMAAYIGIGAGNNFVRLELFSTLSLRGFFETFDLDRRINLPNGINVIEFGPRPGQRAAIFSLSPRRRVIDRGYDVLTQTYDGNTLTIPMGLMVDGRVTLFPDVSWLRWSADLILILGAQRLLIDYTQTPITWGCDASGDGCTFELTGYDHTPSTPQGPRFYINVAFATRRTDVPDMSTAEMFDATGKEPLDQESEDRRSKRDEESVVSRKARTGTVTWDASGCSKRYIKLQYNATFLNNPAGKHRACLRPEFDGVFESRTDYSYLEFDTTTLRVAANQDHKFKRQLAGGCGRCLYSSISNSSHLFGSLRDCSSGARLQGVATIDLRGTFFAINESNSACLCRGNTIAGGRCTCGQWEAYGHNVIMDVHCEHNFQRCVMRCGGSSGYCFLRRGYLQLIHLNAAEQSRHLRYESLVQHGHHSRLLFASDATGCRPVAPCCEEWCNARGYPDFWPVHSHLWDCCENRRLCCSHGGFGSDNCRNTSGDGLLSYAVDSAARSGACDPRPYCSMTPVSSGSGSGDGNPECASFEVYSLTWPSAYGSGGNTLRSYSNAHFGQDTYLAQGNGGACGNIPSTFRRGVCTHLGNTTLDFTQPVTHLYIVTLHENEEGDAITVTGGDVLPTDCRSSSGRYYLVRLHQAATTVELHDRDSGGGAGVSFMLATCTSTPASVSPSSSAPSQMPTPAPTQTDPPTVSPTPVPTVSPTTIPTLAPGVGMTPQGDECVCDCDVCDPPPAFTQLTGSPENAATLANLSVGTLGECQRACATHGECQTMSFDSRTPANRALASLEARSNCNLYASSTRRRWARTADATSAGNIFFQKEEIRAPANAYVHLVDHSDEHHNGATLRWIAAATETECKRACDQTIKCTGVSLYVGVVDDQNCRLVGDDMVYGPWTPSVAGLWSTRLHVLLCDQDPFLQQGRFRWNENVSITSFAKVTDSLDLEDFAPSAHGSNEVFVGETLYWGNATTADECMDLCQQEMGCTGISLHPLGTGIDDMQCRLAASPMEDDRSWVVLADTERRKRDVWRGGFVHLVRRRPQRLADLRECVCWGWIGEESSPPSRQPTGIPSTTPPTTLPPTTAVSMAPVVSNPTLSPTPSPTADPAYTLAVVDEISCVGDASQTCILMHARTKILGLEMRVRIQMAKNANNKWFGSLDAEGSLFGSFLRAQFQVRVALSRPRSFRAIGAIVAQSKEEVLNRVKANLQRKADESTARFERRRAAVDRERRRWDALISRKQAIVNSKRVIFERRAAALRSRADALAQRRANLRARQADLSNICSIRCCRKSCVRRRGARIRCRIRNTVCRVKRAAKVVLLAVAQAFVAVAEAAMRVAAALVDASQVVLDAAILVLEGIRQSGRAALWLAQQGLNALEALVKFGLRLAVKILEGAFRLFYLNEFSFDFQLSRDSKYLSYHLDCTLFGKRIILDSHLDFSSVRSAIRSLVRAIVDVVKAIFKNNRNLRRRGIADEDAQPTASQLLSGQSGVSNVDAPPSSTPVPSHWVTPVRKYRARREEDRMVPARFQSVCEGRCVCHSCIKSVKTYFALLLGRLLQTKGATRAVRRVALVTDSMNTVDHRETLVAEEMVEFKIEALERRAVQHARFASIEEECAESENVSACVLVTTSWEADLDAMAAPDEASVRAVMDNMAEDFAAEDFVGQQYHEVANDAERLSWRTTVTIALANVTQNGIGCSDFECVDVADCLQQAATYLLSYLEALADETVCPNGYTSDNGGGCDRSARLVQQHAARLAAQWRPLVPMIGSAFVPRERGVTTLSDAIELVSKARAVLGMFSAAEICEGRTVIADTSETLGGSETNMRATASESHRAVPPAGPNRNSLLHQLPIYSSVCVGSGLTLTDGMTTSATVPTFSTCEEDFPFVEIPTIAATFVSVVRVSKQCSIGQPSDPAVLGLQIQVKTHAGVFVCGNTVATASDAACDGQSYWERVCHVRVPATAVLVVRPGGGTVSFAEVEASGQASFVSNVLLGQPATSTSQCHERPTFKALAMNEDMYPTTPNTVELLVGGRRQCLDACAGDARCVAVSFFAAPFLTPNGSNCIVSPDPLLGDDVTFTNVPGAGAHQQAVVHHFSKHVPFRRLEAYANHLHDGPLLDQACVSDLADCKSKCAANLRCTGFTLYGDENDRSSASICAMSGTRNGAMASSVFLDGPFAQMPAGGISANLGRPPRLGESSEYNVTENYAIALGLDKLTDGFYQPLTPSLGYMRQGLLHTCGETDSDEVAIPTAERSSVHAVRVWRRCDCCEHRAVGLQVMQRVEIYATDSTTGPAFEWRACGGVSTVEDATCDGDVGPEMQFWQRSCNHTIATTAIKIVRVGSNENGEDLDHRSIDLPEIEAFGSLWVNDPPLGAGSIDADLDEDPDTIIAGYYATTVPTVPDGSPECEPQAEQEFVQPLEDAEARMEPLMICTVGPEADADVDDVPDDDEGTSKADVGAGDDGISDLTIGLVVAAVVGLLLALLLVIIMRRKHARAEGSNGSAVLDRTAPSSIAFNPVFDDAAVSAPPDAVSIVDNRDHHESTSEAVAAPLALDEQGGQFGFAPEAPILDDPPDSMGIAIPETQRASADEAVSADVILGGVGPDSSGNQAMLAALGLPAGEEQFGFGLDDTEASMLSNV